jgi:hypothetical protein
MDGIIKKIFYSKTMDLVKIEFLNSEMIFEFRNGKKNRADMVKKMKLQVGEHVIVVGAKSDASRLYVFGWDIKREGYINVGNCAFVKGTVEKIMDSGTKRMVFVKNGEKLMPVYINAREPVLHTGSWVSVICYAHPFNTCQKPCVKWYTGKCDYCKKSLYEKRYIAMELEENREDKADEINVKTF